MAYGNGGALGGPNTTGYASSAPQPVESPSQIRDALTLAEQTSGDLHNTIDRLLSRLDTVLSPIPPDVNKAGPGQPTAATSDLHGRVHRHAYTLAQAVERLNDLMRRIEV